MKLGILRALLMDAYYQVLDNLMFRILVGLIAMLVIPTWIIGMREDEIVVLFGLKSYSYDGLLGFLSGFNFRPEGMAGVHQQVLRLIQSVYVEYVAGIYGIMFCLAATAFFLPRMLEKGAADTVFSKPVSRLTLLLTRYFTGVIFVSLLSIGLVGGLYIGFRVGSGWDDKSIFWAAPTMVYQYSLLHAFSSLIATRTRSSIVAILCTYVLFGLTGCVNNYAWVPGKYYTFLATQGLEQVQGKIVIEQGDSTGDADKDEDDDGGHPVAVFLERTVETLHYTLPKTFDADILMRKLRSTLAGESLAFELDGEKFAIARHPEGFGPESLEKLTDPGLSWVQMEAAGKVRARLTLTRKSRQPEATEEEPKPRRISSSRKRRELEKALKERTDVELHSAGPQRRVGKVVGAHVVNWTETLEASQRIRQTTFFTHDDYFYILELDASADTWDEDNWDLALDSFLSDIRLTYTNHNDWYEDQFGWTSELKYNAFFSIGSSLLFAIMCLLAAWWILLRTDF